MNTPHETTSEEKCCINCDDLGNCAFADCKCHYAMSEEVKEKSWEKRFSSEFMNNGINGVLDDRFQDSTIVRIRDFIDSERSLAQQEILREIIDEVDKIHPRILSEVKREEYTVGQIDILKKVNELLLARKA